MGIIFFVTSLVSMEYYDLLNLINLLSFKGLRNTH